MRAVRVLPSAHNNVEKWIIIWMAAKLCAPFVIFANANLCDLCGPAQSTITKQIQIQVLCFGALRKVSKYHWTDENTFHIFSTLVRRIILSVIRVLFINSSDSLRWTDFFNDRHFVWKFIHKAKTFASVISNIEYSNGMSRR